MASLVNQDPSAVQEDRDPLVKPAFVAAQVRQAQLDLADFRVYLATQALPAIPVYPEIQGLGVLQDFQVLRVSSDSPAKQVQLGHPDPKDSLVIPEIQDNRVSLDLPDHVERLESLAYQALQDSDYQERRVSLVVLDLRALLANQVHQDFREKQAGLDFRAIQGRLDSLVCAVLPDNKALLDVRVQLAGLDLPDRQVILDLLAVQVVPVSLDFPAVLALPDLQVWQVRQAIPVQLDSQAFLAPVVLQDQLVAQGQQVLLVRPAFKAHLDQEVLPVLQETVELLDRQEQLDLRDLVDL